METTPVPFPKVLVPYDGSEPARAALTLALTFARHGAALTLATIIDETAAISQAVSDTIAYDPGPVLKELDVDGAALLAEAAATCRAAGVTAVTDSVHERPIAGILELRATHGCDLIVMGTHGRAGLPRLFLGSTTDGILRSSPVPVLTVRDGDQVAPDPLAEIFVCIDDSEPAGAAARIAGQLAHSAGSKVSACSVIQTDIFYQNAVTFGFDPENEIAALRDATGTIVRETLSRASLATATPVDVVDGDPADELLAQAKERHATLIIVGTHGRGGLQRFFLGSVAERLVRSSTIPVLVVPVAH